jgi:hypothetical protein
VDETDRPAVDIDLLAASLRADSSDVSVFVESLATKLQELVPGRVRVFRWRTRMFGPKVIGHIALDLGDRRLELQARDGVIETSCARLSGGIVLKSEKVGIDAWVAAVGEALADEARRNETTRKALERLLIQ